MSKATKRTILRNLIIVTLFPAISFAHDGPPVWLIPAIPFVLPFMSMKNNQARLVAKAVALERLSEESLLTPQGKAYGIRVNYRIVLGKDFPAEMGVAPNCDILTHHGNEYSQVQQLSCFEGNFTDAKGKKMPTYSIDKISAGDYRISYLILPVGLSMNFDREEPRCLYSKDVGVYFATNLELSLTDKIAVIGKMNRAELPIMLSFYYRVAKLPYVELPKKMITAKIDPISLLLNANSMGLPICK